MTRPIGRPGRTWPRRRVLFLLGGLALAWPPPVHAQPSARVRRIGVLLAGTDRDPVAQRRLAALRAGLEQRGWMEGRNATLEVRYVAGSPARAPALATEMVAAKVDIIVASGTELVRAAQRASSTVPVVMAAVGDPVGAGLVASLAQPGGNVTGLSLMAPGLQAKRVELAKEIIPGLARIAILWNPANASVALRVKETEAAARAAGLKVESIEVRQPGDIDTALRAATRVGAQALFTTEEPLILDHRVQILRLATQSRLPTISGLRWFVEAGGLLSYGPNDADMWRRAAGYVDRILAGARPADLPVEQPTRFELVVNMKTAGSLKLVIPQSVLLRADEVIR